MSTSIHYKYKIFLSHNRRQKDWVRELAERLENLGTKVFFDEKDIKPGEDVVDAITRGIDASRYVVLIISRSSLTSTWVATEQAITIYSDPQALKRKLIPVILEPVDEGKIYPKVSRLNMTYLTDPKTREQKFAALWRSLGIPDDKIPEPPPWPKPSKGRARKKAPPSPVAAEADKEMVFVKASNFKMGSGDDDDYTEDFYIDKYPVTNAEYKKFLDYKKRRVPRSWDKKTKTYPAGKGDHPVRGISFYDAKAYAEWVKKRLPTEKEWEKAARGARGRQYPWGNGFKSGKCNTLEAKIKDTTRVVQFDPVGASPYGVIDMAGNVWEWVDTWAQQNAKKIKGGSYQYDQDAAVCSNSDSHNITSGRPFDVGFRCVKDVV